MKMGLKKRRRIQLIIASFVALGLAVVGLGVGFREGVQYYRTPSEILEKPPHQDEVFRVGGLVSEGSVRRAAGGEISFILDDGTAKILVTFKGILPDLFEEKQGAIALGKYQNEVFKAVQILAKHDENYKPRILPIDTVNKDAYPIKDDAQAQDNRIY